ncbi:MAG: hypothetical protein R3C20_14795 [Planctomycetaceae bacterium]
MKKTKLFLTTAAAFLQSMAFRSIACRYNCCERVQSRVGTKFGRLAACMLASTGLAGLALPDLSAQETVATNVSRFEIPFEVEAAPGETAQGFAVLYGSLDGGATWDKLQTVAAADEVFQFSAPRDGTYAFAVRMADAAGNLQSEIVGSRPELQVRVDTTAPELRLDLYEVAPGEVVLGWQTPDAAADLQSLSLEYADGQDGRWKTVPVTQPTLGQTSLQVAAGSVVSVRGTLVDAAGNQTHKSAQLVLKPVGAPQKDPTSLPTASPNTPTGSTVSNQAVGSGLPVQAMGPNPFAPTGNGPTFAGISPQIAPGTSATRPPAAVPFAGGFTNAGSVMPPVAPGFTQPAVAGPVPGYSSAPVTSTPPAAAAIPAQQTVGSNQPLLVNSSIFDLMYQVEDVGPSGVGSVEIYITENGGQEWFTYGNDSDLQSPFQVDVRGEGTFGFAVRVRNGLGFVDPPPQPGDVPSIVVTVDQTAPLIHMAAPTVRPDGSGIVDLQWQITEQMPSGSPVRLEYSTAPTGPWTPAFDWQSDAGYYQWPVRPGTPPSMYFRLLARDAAGNVGSVQTTQPVLIDLKRPTVSGLRIQAVSTGRPTPGY